MVGKEKTMATGRRRDGEEDPNGFFLFSFLNSSWINEGHFLFLLSQLCVYIYIYFAKSQFFFDGCMNHGYAILNDIITNIYKLVY